MEFGKTLRLAREAKGYTIAQLAETTRLAPALINDLENEELGQIAAPIYGRGFIKLYCEAVGIDPKPLINEFMEILNGNRDPHIKERGVHEPAGAILQNAVVPPPDSVRPPAEPVRAPAEPIQEPVETVSVSAEPVLTKSMPTVSEDASDSPQQADLFSESFHTGTPTSSRRSFVPSEPEPAPQGQTISRYAAGPLRAIGSTPPAFWRIGSLVLAALIFLALLFFGLKALHRTMTSPTPPSEERIEESVETKSSAPTANVPKEPRVPQPVPALYLD